MLVLTRKLDQSILIGDDVEIKIVQIKGAGPNAQVRIGVVAPPGVTILRKEVYEAVRAENLRAAGSTRPLPSAGIFERLPPEGAGE